MKRFLLLLLLFLAPPVWAGDYTLTLSGDSSAACTISFSTEAESVDGTHPLQAGNITDFACTITETDPDLVLDENDLQYPTGLDYRVSEGKVTALDLQTTTGNMLQIGIAEPGKISDGWQLFGTGSLLNSAANRAVMAEDTRAVLRVGPSEQYTTLSDAIAASQEGDTILVEAGIYESDYATIGHDLTIKGINGLANLVAKEPIPNGKGILVINANVTIENVKFSDASVPYQNGAGIRHEGGDLIVRDSIFENNENGLLSGHSGSITILGSEFIGNGYGDGYSHGIYAGRLSSLVIEDCTFRDTKVGHHIKSRAEQTTVRNSLIDDGAGDASYSIDLPYGGQALLEGNTIIQTGSVSVNNTMVAYGAEGNLHANSSLLVKGNTFIDYHANGKGVVNSTNIVVTLQGNTFQDVETVVIGPHEIVGDSGPNNAPVAVDDAVTTSEDTSATVDVLANDTDPDGDALTVTEAGTPHNGATVLNQDGTITYTPAAGFHGSDSFTYVVDDGNGDFASAVVNVTVTADGINHAPVAVDDAVSVSQGIETRINVLTNDTDPDGDPKSVTLVTQPSDGTVAIAGGGQWVTYTSNDPFTGTPDAFTYTVSDGTDTDVGTVTVTRVSVLTLAQQAATMAPGEWRKLDTVNEFWEVAVTDAERAEIEAMYPGGGPIAGWGGSARTLHAWNGAAWDDVENRFLFFGGGHASYGGNEVYEFDVDTLTWERLTLPSALTLRHDAGGKTWWLPRDADSDGKADQPGVSHMYDAVSFNSTLGVMVVPQQQTMFPEGSVYGAQNINPNYYTFDPDTAQWTRHDGHFYWFGVCEYIAERNYSLCWDSLGTTYHNLYLIHDNGTEEFCGQKTSAPQEGTPGHMHRDEDTGEIYDVRYNNITKITLTGDDCNPTFTVVANPTTEELGTSWPWSYTGIGTGYDGNLYLWGGSQEIVVYDKTAKTFELRSFATQSATGPHAPSASGGRKPLSKWRCFETPHVCLGIEDPQTNQNARGGFWLWKIGTEGGTPEQAELGAVELDGSTQSTLSVYMPVAVGTDSDYDSVAYVEYRPAGGGAWTRGVDLFRQRPDHVSINRGLSKNPEGYHGMIFGLTPGTDYDVRVTVSDPDGTTGSSAQQTLSAVSTKAMPITDYTGFGETIVTSAAQLESASIAECDGAGVGHIFTIPADTTITSNADRIQFGPISAGNCGADADNPIVLRGAHPTTSVIDCTNANGGKRCLDIYGGNVIVENLRLTSSDNSADFGINITGRTGGCHLDNVTVRDVTIDGTQVYGISTGCTASNLYLADNTITGPKDPLDVTSGGGAIGIVASGRDIEIEHNTIKGWIDGITRWAPGSNPDPDLEQNFSHSIHNNLILYGTDDAIELDFFHRNGAVYQNLAANTSDCVSAQPVWGGPAYVFKNICINTARGPVKIKAEQDDPKGLMLWNNTFAKQGYSWIEQAPGVYWHEMDIRNNIFYGAGTVYSPGLSYTMLIQAGVPNGGAVLGNGVLNVFDYNGWYYTNDDYFTFAEYGDNNGFAAWVADAATSKYGGNDTSLAGETVFDSYVPDFDDEGSGSVFGDHYRDPTGKDFALHSGSSAIGAGVEIKGITDATPDLGACDTNDTDGSCVSTGTFYGVR